MSFKIVRKHNETLLTKKFSELKVGETFVLSPMGEGLQLYQKFDEYGAGNTLVLGAKINFLNIKADTQVFPVDVFLNWSYKYRQSKGDKS